MSEIWKPILGYEEFYEASNMGRIKGLRRNTISVPNNNGKYQHYTLSKNGKTLSIGVHRLVMWAFVGPQPEGYVVDHINSIKSDNRLENLEYVTYTENNLRAFARVAQNLAELTSEQIATIQAMHAVGLHGYAIFWKTGIESAVNSRVYKPLSSFEATMKPLELDKLIEKSGKTPFQFFSDLIEGYSSITDAARSLGVSRQAFYNQCEKHGIEVRTRLKAQQVKKG